MYAVSYYTPADLNEFVASSPYESRATPLCDWCEDEGRIYALIDPDSGDHLTLCQTCAAEHARAVLHRQPIQYDQAQEQARHVLRSIAVCWLWEHQREVFHAWRMKRTR